MWGYLLLGIIVGLFLFIVYVVLFYIPLPQFIKGKRKDSDEMGE